ncbi:MAG: Tfp pilus assembly protein FimT/FimU [Gammaproteobacteria bacterium]
MSTQPQRAAGMTLLEVLIVVAILSIVAAVSLPSLSSTDPYKLEFAAEEVSSALRFARSEALRTGQAHGVTVDRHTGDPPSDELTVYHVDLGQSPFGIESILHHPVRKQVYTVRIGTGPITAGISITGPGPLFHFSGLTDPQQHVHFDATGAPVYFKDAVAHRFTGGDIRLSDGKDQRWVRIQPITGRVMVR